MPAWQELILSYTCDSTLSTNNDVVLAKENWEAVSMH